MAALKRIGASSAVLLILLSSVSFSEARDHLVGGKSDPWKVPDSSEPDSLNRWASKSRFLIGDSLVWKYDGSKDSVLQVTKKDYLTCNVSSPIEKYTDGDTKVMLQQSGPYYFVSGEQGHCEKGQKLIVVVMSERHHQGISPAKSPAAESPTVAPAPTSATGSGRGGSDMVAVALALGGLLAVM